jgi:glycosyltransferase involved in cell wall biosynthesis
LRSFLKPEDEKNPREMTRIVCIISDIDKALSFEWIAQNLKSKFDLRFILIAKEGSEFSYFLKRHSIRFYEVGNHESRIRKWWLVLRILQGERPSIVHTHLWQANLLGLSASWLLRIKKRIYTRHHATVHYQEHPSGRKWDLLCNFLATEIIAISENISEILIRWDKANPKKIKLIYHGFDFDYFNNVSNRQTNALRAKQNLQKNDSPVIGVISRYMEWKGIQYIIPAFQKVLIQFPAAKLILANAHGSYKAEIKQLLTSLPPQSFVEIQFEEDLAALYKIFDVFVHVPIGPHVEAFGQTYIESLASGVPSVFTLSGIAREFVEHDFNAWVVDYKNSDQIAAGITKVLVDKNYRQMLSVNGLKSVQKFSLETHILALERLYKEH